MNKRGIITIIIIIAIIVITVTCIMSNNYEEEKRRKSEEVYDLSGERSFCTSIGRNSSYCIFSISDETGRRIESATFEIYEKHHILVGSSNSNYDGKAGFSGMEDQTYYIRVVGTPEEYENHNIEYVITPDGKNNCFKKNIKIKRGEKVDIDTYEQENITPFENKDIAVDTNALDYVIRYNTLMDDRFEGTQVKLQFSDAEYIEEKNYPLRRKVSLSMDNATILSYSVSVSGNREDYANILDMNDNKREEFNGNEAFYIATNSYITEGDINVSLTFKRNERSYAVTLTQSYSLINRSDYGRFVINTLDEKQTKVEGKNGIYKLYNNNGEPMEFVDYSGDTATITYRNIKPDWYRIDRIIDDKVIESQKILVQNNFITYLWM